jgi:hypothetical protein
MERKKLGEMVLHFERQVCVELSQAVLHCLLVAHSFFCCSSFLLFYFSSFLLFFVFSSTLSIPTRLLFISRREGWYKPFVTTTFPMLAPRLLPSLLVALPRVAWALSTVPPLLMRVFSISRLVMLCAWTHNNASYWSVWSRH